MSKSSKRSTTSYILTNDNLQQYFHFDDYFEQEKSNEYLSKKNSLINVEALPKLTKMTMTHLMHFIKVKGKRTALFAFQKYLLFYNFLGKDLLPFKAKQIFVENKAILKHDQHVARRIGHK